MRNKFLSTLGNTRLYPITDRTLSGLSHGEQVRILSEAGAPLIQLREKDLSPLEFYNEAVEASRLVRQLGKKLIINDRVDIALAVKADGVHLGQEDLPPFAARTILGEEFIIGYSSHNLKQAELAIRMPVDYIAIGPIFGTRTKQSPNQPVGLEGLQQIRQAVGDFPLIAIGGITSLNANDALAAGADAVAVIRGLWETEDLTSNFRFLLNP